MKIFHTGDLHLDSPFSSVDPVSARERRGELRQTFADMMTYCAENAVDLVLISGDAVDSDFVTKDTVMTLKRGFAKLKCPVVIAPGNHDPAENSSIWKRDLLGSNVHVFTQPSLTCFSFDSIGADVYGWAFTSRFMTECPLGELHPERPERINILCAHGDTSSPISRSCPLPLAALKEFGADWCALGHIHNPEAANAAMEGIGAYCGCPEGRDFGECGEKSAVLITIEEENGKKTVNTERISFAKRIYRQAEISCTGAADTAQIADLVKDAVLSGGYGKETLLRIILTGSVDPTLNIDTRALEKSVGGLYFIRVVNETSPTWNGELLKKDKGIRGEVFRQLLPMLESSDKDDREKGARALRYALAALAGEDIADI